MEFKEIIASFSQRQCENSPGISSPTEDGHSRVLFVQRWKCLRKASVPKANHIDMLQPLGAQPSSTPLSYLPSHQVTPSHRKRPA